MNCKEEGPVIQGAPFQAYALHSVLLVSGMYSNGLYDL